jgi:hypothetical protein
MSLQFLNMLNGENSGLFKNYLESFKINAKPKIAWYPSSGNDFRDLFYLNKKFITKHLKSMIKWSQPDIFIHTDEYEPLFCELFPSEFRKGWYIFNDNRTSIWVKYFECLPQLHTCDLSNIVYLELEIKVKNFDVFEAKLIYANVENGCFANKLIEEKAHISHITNVRWGYGSGGYLKNILPKLNTKYFINDGHLDISNMDIETMSLYPNLLPNEKLPILEALHTIDGKSWSDHGDVTFYTIN